MSFSSLETQAVSGMGREKSKRHRKLMEKSRGGRKECFFSLDFSLRKKSPVDELFSFVDFFPLFRLSLTPST